MVVGDMHVSRMGERGDWQLPGEPHTSAGRTVPHRA